MTAEYLKEKQIKAVPYDKVLGFCLMREKEYNARLELITNLPQFKALEQNRKNAKHPVLKEEERITGILKDLKKKEKIDEELYTALKPRGSKPAQLYGLSKVHKMDVPLRPIVSIPGTAYDKIGKWVSHWLDIIPESKIQTDTKNVKKELKNIKLDEDEVLISFDVTQLYTNVPVDDSIEMAAIKL